MVESNELREILELDDRRREALLSGDAAVLETLFADELTYIHSTNAVVDTKETYLSAFRSGNLLYRQIDLEDRKIHIYDNTATLTGVARMRVFFKAEDRTIQVRYAIVWVKKQTWQIVLFASTAMSAQDSGRQDSSSR